MKKELKSIFAVLLALAMVFSLAGTVVGSIIIRTIVTFVYYFGIVSEATMAFKAMIIIVIIVLQSEPVRNKMSRIEKKKVTGGVQHV